MAIRLADLNRLDREAFTAALAGIFEASPWVAERAWDARPFPNLECLHGALWAVVAQATADEKLALIRAHPDLAGKAARAGALGAESSREQSEAGLDRLSAEEAARFARLNRAYREKFGFPFVICARENRKQRILEGFSKRLANSRAEEIETALGEIGRIAHFRLRDAVSET
jgi:2-oxo-4-hydroxy-4-carboxy-5-ureidoimidazoline decarboxylase